MQGADAVGESAAVSHPQVVLHVIVLGGEMVNVAVGPLVAHIHIVAQTVVPLPAAGGADGLECRSPLVAKNHVVETELAVDVDMHAHTVAHTELVAGIEEGETSVVVDTAEGFAKLNACAVVLDAVHRGVVTMEQGTPGREMGGRSELDSTYPATIAEAFW